MTIELFGVIVDLEPLRIPVAVAVAVLAIVLLFFLTSKVLKFVLIVVCIVALGLVLWWALQHYGLV
jgi:hypothetical protein